jgi:hypothetical protein
VNVFTLGEGRLRLRLGALALPLSIGAGFAIAGGIGGLACEATTPLPEVNVAYGARPAPSPSPSASTLPLWEHHAALSTWTKANARRFSSAGHYFGRYDADIVVNPIASASYAVIGPGRSVPVGAVIAKVHRLAGADDPGPILAVEKRTDGLEFVEMDEKGRVVRRGALHPCVDCHEHVASQDALFGVPMTGR